MNFKAISFALYAAVAFLSLVFGVIYLSKKEFMPYHSKAVGQKWEDVDSRFQALIKALMRVSAGGYLSTFFAISLMLAFPFKNNEGWVLMALPLVSISTSATSLLGTLIVKNNTDANPPWRLACVTVILSVWAFSFQLMT